MPASPAPFPGRAVMETWLRERDLSLTPEQWALLEAYLRQVEAYNRKVNLTSDAGEALLLRHAGDAMAAWAVLKARLGSESAPRLLDIGAGAGFIGIVLRIAWPEAAVTLLEASQRKYRFLNLAAVELRLPGLRVVLGQAPEALRGKTFDAALVRAVAPLTQSSRLARNAVRPGGIALVYQTEKPSAVEYPEALSYRLPGEDFDRHLVLV